MKCPKCQKRYKVESRKETVSELMDQPTTATNYRMLYCPKCKHKVFYKVD